MKIVEDYNRKLEVCLCNNKLPKLSKETMYAAKSYTYRYICVKCNTSTFGTGNELCSRELWNSAIDRKRVVINKK